MGTMDEKAPGLKARVRAVCDARGMTQEEWSQKADLSRGYLNTYLSRSEALGRRLPEKGAEALARVAGVSLEWLRDGRGTMDAGAHPARPTPRTPSDPPPPAGAFTREPKAAELAVSEAFERARGRFTHRTLLAALDLVRRSEMMLPPDRELAVIAAEGLLAGVAEVQRREEELTYVSLVNALLTDRARAAAEARDRALNAEGDADLAALGASRPAVPVRTPARPLHAVDAPSTKHR